MKTALSIAGSDPSGGAGIQADIKTMTVHGVYAMSAITALTAQNTTGVTGIYEVTPKFLEMQLEAVFTDIFPDAIKIGMVYSEKLIKVIAEKLQSFKPERIVIDPVMVSTSGSKLMNTDALAAFREALLPLATIVTPNIPEAEVLAGMPVQCSDDMITAAKTIHDQYGCAVLLKGGHSTNDANDFLFEGKKGRWFFTKKILTNNTHGTGCTLSSAIAANLAKGCSIAEAVQKAKTYICGALTSGLDLGKGQGPLNHAFGYPVH